MRVRLFYDRSVLIALGAALLTAIGLSGIPAEGAAAQHGGETRPDSTDVSSDLELADGLSIRPFADYPMLASPVGIEIDDRGVVYVTETNRRKSSNLDIRDHRDWMIEDLNLTTIAEKRRFYKRKLAPSRSDTNSSWLADRNGDGSHDWKDLTVETERVHRIVDRDGDFRADTSTVFAKDFDSVVTGVAAGVLPLDSTVYVTVAPDIWRVQDEHGDGISDRRTSLSHGYGVHMSFAGHDMSGPTRGPDGKIYWSIGDIGLNVEGPDGRRWKYPNQGAVMRMNPDGSEFEVFAHGLRNPQEIAFDRHGNLFSVDNDGDYPGERERIVYITEGSDTGWRTNWQFGKYSDPAHNDYNVWLDEGLHVPRFDGQPAYITPAVALYRNGPSGFAYNPGTALGTRWRDFFFSSHFTGSAAQSHVSAFRVEPKGATFELAEARDVVRGVLIPSLAFGPSGGLYLADWIDGWDVRDQGRIWRISAAHPAPKQKETARLLEEGMSERTTSQLRTYLAHADMRVRMQAQFELAGRGAEGERVLRSTALDARDRLARLHGVWGLGQIGERRASAVEPLVDLLEDEDPEIRAQSAKVLGEAGFRQASDALVDALDDSEARVRFFSAIALGKLDAENARPAIVRMLEENGGRDAYLRHAGAEGLARLGDPDALAELSVHRSPSVRRAAVVALRQVKSPLVARFLDDADPRVATEAARAVHDDFSIEGAMPELARTIDRPPTEAEAFLRRAINANLRLGEQASAERLARLGARTGVSEAMRVEALTALRQWPDPPALDRVTGRYRGLEERDPAGARSALAAEADRLLRTESDTVLVATIRAAGALEYREAGDRLVRLVQEEHRSSHVRVAAVRALGELENPRFEESVEAALASSDNVLREAGLELLTELDVEPDRSASMLEEVLRGGSVDQKQRAFRLLGEMSHASADSVLAGWMDRLLAGEVSPELELDLVQAARSSGAARVESRLEHYRTQVADELLGTYRATRYGGDPRAGREIFFEHTSAQCARCHSVGGRGGGAVGPDLTDIGARRGRSHLVESLIAPGADIAPGFGSVTLTLQDGSTVSGTYLGESADSIRVGAGSEGSRSIARSRIASRRFGPSSMPPMKSVLTREQIRDVVAYLASLRGT